MPPFDPTPEVLVSVSGILLSLIFTYVPGLRERFARERSEVKALAMLVLLVCVTVGVWLGGCYQFWDGVSCDRQGAQRLVWTFVLALMSNQATYVMSPTPQSVEQAKESRDLGMTPPRQ